MRPFAFVAAVVLLLAVAGCGVTGEHSLDKTRSCLEKKGVRIARPTGDFVATTASGGAFRAYLHGRKGNFVTLSFNRDDEEAQRTALGYDRFHGKTFGVEDILFTDHNVTMLWKVHPSDADAKLITGCLK